MSSALHRPGSKRNVSLGAPHCVLTRNCLFHLDYQFTKIGLVVDLLGKRLQRYEFLRSQSVGLHQVVVSFGLAPSYEGRGDVPVSVELEN